MKNITQEQINTDLFRSLIYTFALTAKQQLGSIANPIIGHSEQDLEQVSLTLDMLIVLRTKTVGNLSEDETVYLNETIDTIQSALKESLVKPEKV